MPNSGRTVILLNLGLGDIALAGVGTGLLGGQSSNGYWKFPGIIDGERKELIMQWYTAIATQAGAITVNFPIPFPNTFLADAVLPGGSGTALVNGGNVSQISRQLYCNNPMSVAVITIGY
ncbi:hypothetical protein [Mangrovibacter phragmitis]|uniref:gp53-like domain-containing protein n=1 Tax=Mangrovibacter phragmitis TaxID=1691903 RepID=UPI00336A0348